MFEDWCEIDESPLDTGKVLFALVEKPTGRSRVRRRLIERVRSHYDDLSRVSEDIEALGFPGASTILQERLPRTSKARSGEIGEILAVEFIESKTAFRIPIRRLRYKDGREMALRGDDFVGLRVESGGRLLFLKGEAKSRRNMSQSVVNSARAALCGSEGRPTAISLLFVADRLLESDGDDEQLGRSIRQEVALRSVPAQRITHALFLLSGNPASSLLSEDLRAADGDNPQIGMTMHIDDHQPFIAAVFEGAGNLGND